MKRMLLSMGVVLSMLSPFGLFATNKNALVVYLKDGTSTVFQLDHQPIVQLADGCLCIISTKISMNFPREQVQRFMYSYVDSEGVFMPPQDMFHGVIADNMFILSGLISNSVVRLISVDGKLLSEVRTNGDGKVNIPLDAYPSGVYVLQSKGFIHKFTKP